MHRLRRQTVALLTLLLALGAVGNAFAQDRQPQHIFTPAVSQKASVSQTFGVTDVSIHYHRPAVNEREIWGKLVPFGQMWRTGANENTLISFSTEVSIEGQALAAGEYGVHTIPGESEWTLVFSRDTTAWGSYSYEENNDALRVTVKPVEASFHQERLAFTFDDVSNEGMILTLHWAQLAVPVKVEANLHELALASFRDQLKGLSKFFWQGPNQAANYCLQNEINYQEALEWAEQSIRAKETFNNLSTKAQLLQKVGKEDEVEDLMARAMKVGSAGELFGYARKLLGEGQKEESVEISRANVERNPDVWFVDLGLARGLSALGRYQEAAEAMKKSLGKAPENRKTMVQGLLESLEKGEDIN
jgi:tetratricopeptide (TPR) repeat protein